MDRRTLLKLLGAMSIAGCSAPSAPRLRVVVAGAGIVGASIAWHLAKAGADVIVIDRAGPATHASRGTFAWINATWAKQPRHYHALSQDGLSSWKNLEEELSLSIRWGGSLEWFGGEARQATLVEQIAEQVEWGEPARMVDAAEFATLEPNVMFESGELAAFSPNDGAVDPVLATHRLLAAAEALGAATRFPAELTDVVLKNNRLVAVETSTGRIEADRLVVATGAAPDIPARIAGIDIPQRSTPGIIALTRPTPRLLNRIVVAPGIHLHQRDDGRIVLGEQDGAPQNEAHAERLVGRPNSFPAQSIAFEHATRMLATATRFVPGMTDAAIEDAYIGWRPLPVDGHPVLGSNPERPDVYLAIMHSGVSLAPIVGQLVAREVTGDEFPRLDAYRPTRKFSTVRRY